MHEAAAHLTLLLAHGHHLLCAVRFLRQSDRLPLVVVDNDQAPACALHHDIACIDLILKILGKEDLPVARHRRSMLLHREQFLLLGSVVRRM